jgi:hypothetical protein
MLAMKSLTPMTSASVELLELSFCFWHILNNMPMPQEIPPPVWLFMSMCTANDASTNDFILPMSTHPKTNLSSRVPRRYCSTRLSFLQSSSSGLETLVVRNATAFCMSSRHLLQMYSNWPQCCGNAPPALFLMEYYPPARQKGA